MTSFALISEGITDQVVLSAILYGYYEEEPDIREVQPIRDETDQSRQGNFSNWEKVLEYCSLDYFEQTFSTNDYTIIQIDSDVAEEKNFGIDLTNEGVEKSVPQLVSEIKNLLIKKIGERVYEIYKDRIIFAIAIHSIECWLLPLYAKDAAGSNRTKRCEHHLGYAVRHQKLHYEKEFRSYEKISRPLEKFKNIEICAKQNESLRIFIDCLPRE